VQTEHRIHALRIVEALNTSSTRPLLVDTDSGRFVVKLVHGPEGPRALAAEWLCQRLARRLELPTLELAPVVLEPTLAAGILDSELREAVQRGAGLCLGLRELGGARPATLRELERAPDDFALPLLWFDILVDNPDRRKTNPNVLRLGSLLIPIDHAASLSFHHDWQITEQTPGEALEVPRDHVFGERARSLAAWHPALRDRLDRQSLLEACDSLPAEWLGAAAFDTKERERAAYFAILWKRLRHLDAELAAPG
jgi:HipA-like protein